MRLGRADPFSGDPFPLAVREALVEAYLALQTRSTYRVLRLGLSFDYECISPLQLTMQIADSPT